MHLLGVLSVVLQSHLLILWAQGIHKKTVGVTNITSQRFMDRATRHHLPTYMMHLYRNFKTNQSRPMDFIEQAPAKQADTVRSIMAKSLAHRDRHWIATFDFSSLLDDKKIQAAELRIRVPRTVNPTNVTVEIRHQQDYPCQGDGMCLEHHSMGLLSASSMISMSRHWRVYSVTSLLLDWLKEKQSFRKRPSKTKGHLHSPGPVQLTNQKLAQGVSDRALLVVFSHTGSDEDSQDKASLLYTAEKSKFLFNTENKEVKRTKRHRSKSKRGRRGQPMRRPEVPQREDMMSLCRKVDMHIDFNQIGWGSWIVFPKRYNAYRCEGSCPSPLGEEFKPTNHAYMQSLLKYYHPNRVPAACCAPMKMSPLSMLYYENGEMLLRHHEDMVVEECGCH